MRKNFKIYGLFIVITIIIYCLVATITSKNQVPDVSKPNTYTNLFNSAGKNKRDVVIVSYGTSDVKTYKPIVKTIQKAQHNQLKNNVLIGVVKYNGRGTFTDWRDKFVSNKLTDDDQLIGRIKISKSTSLLDHKNMFDSNNTDVMNLVRPNKEQAKLPTTITHYVLNGHVWMENDSIIVKDSSKTAINNMLSNNNQ